MANVIKNGKLLDFLDSDKLRKIEFGALQHQKFSRISFKILDAEPDLINIEVRQSKNPNGNYFDSDILIQRTKELFSKFLPQNWIIQIVAIPYQESPVQKVTPEFIKERMESLEIKSKDIVADTGLDKTNISAWISGARPMSQTVMAMFYYYFQSKDLDLKEDLEHIYSTITIDEDFKQGVPSSDVSPIAYKSLWLSRKFASKTVQQMLQKKIHFLIIENRRGLKDRILNLPKSSQKVHVEVRSSHNNSSLKVDWENDQEMELNHEDLSELNIQ